MIEIQFGDWYKIKKKIRKNDSNSNKEESKDFRHIKRKQFQIPVFQTKRKGN